jgi:hypothetical protein
VTLRDGDYGNLKYEVIGEDKVVFDATNRLDEWIDEARPWYSRLATADFVLLVVALWGIAFVALIAFVAVYSIVTLMTAPAAQLAEPVPPTRASTLWVNATYGVFGASLLLAWLAGLIRRPLFPVATFRLGGGIKRDDTARFWRVFVGGTILVPLLMAVALNWFASRT